MNEKKIIQVEEKVPAKLLIPLSIQHMFAMFGASVRAINTEAHSGIHGNHLPGNRFLLCGTAAGS